MENRKRPMDKTVVSLMCDKIRNLKVDVDEMAYKQPEKCIRFIHECYDQAEEELDQLDESQS